MISCIEYKGKEYKHVNEVIRDFLAQELTQSGFDEAFDLVATLVMGLKKVVKDDEI